MQVTTEVKIKFNSHKQKHVFERVCFSDKYIIYITGGANSGKSFATGCGLAAECLTNAGIVCWAIKNDLQNCKNTFLPPIRWFLDCLGIKESHSKRNNNSFFIDSERTILFANHSEIRFAVIDTPSPYGGSSNKFHGTGGNIFVLDEGTEIGYPWFDYFANSGRNRKSPNQKEPYRDKIIVTENQSALHWGSKFFFEKVDPVTLNPLCERIVEGRPYTELIETIRLETWENKMLTERQLDMLRTGGDADRYYYSDASRTKDIGQIYQYTVTPFVQRYYNIYAIDFGDKAKTGILQIGFGGSYDINIRELCYKSSMLLADVLIEVGKIIEGHKKVFDELLFSIDIGVRQFLANYHRMPYIVIDSARPDMKREIEKKYPGQCIVLLSKKQIKKEHAVQRVKRLNFLIDKSSKFLLNEIGKFRYKKNSIENSEIVPDGDDDLLDPLLYGSRYILEEVLHVQQSSLYFGPYHNLVWEKLKNGRCTNTI